MLRLEQIITGDDEQRDDGFSYLYQRVVRHFTLDGYGKVEDVLDNPLLYELPNIVINLLQDDGYSDKNWCLELLDTIALYAYKPLDELYNSKAQYLRREVCIGIATYLSLLRSPVTEIRHGAVAILSKCSGVAKNIDEFTRYTEIETDEELKKAMYRLLHKLK